jgi:hypothetical protein
MSTEETGPAQGKSEAAPKQPVSHWRTAAERAEALRARMLRRRAAHRVALKRSHTKG